LVIYDNVISKFSGGGGGKRGEVAPDWSSASFAYIAVNLASI
jgi:hypothetical protein